MTHKKQFIFGAIVAIIGTFIFLGAFVQGLTVAFGAPQVFIATPATSTPKVNFSFLIGTTSPSTLFGSTTLAVYGSTTLQTWIDTEYAFLILNAASSTVFQVDTINSSTTASGIFNTETLNVVTCNGCGSSVLTANLDAGGFDITNGGIFTMEHIVATSTTATSTLAGGFAIETTGFVYNFSTNFVGIGTAIPNDILHIVSDQNAETTLVVDNANAGTAASSYLRLRNATNDNDSLLVGVQGTGLTTSGGFIQDGGVIAAETGLSGGLALITRASAPIRFYTGGHTNERMRIDNVGNVGIGDTSPTYTLDVTGLGRFTGLLDASHFVATSTTATSTLAGGLTIETTGFVYDFSTNSVGIGLVPISGVRLLLPQEDDDVTPTLSFGDGDSGFYETSDDTIRLTLGGGADFQFGETDFRGVSTGAGQLMDETGSNTNPTIIGYAADFDTGLAGDGGNTLFLITNGTTKLIVTSGGNIGIGTTSPGTLLSVGDTSGINFTEATSTFRSTGGINLNDGCFAISGNCVGEETQIVSFNIASTSMSTTTGTFAQYKFARAATIVRISCSANVGTSTIQFDERTEGTESTAGTDVLSSALSCGSGSDTNASTAFDNAGIAADNVINLTIEDSEPTGSAPTIIMVHVDYQ